MDTYTSTGGVVVQVHHEADVPSLLHGVEETTRKLATVLHVMVAALPLPVFGAGLFATSVVAGTIDDVRQTCFGHGLDDAGTDHRVDERGLRNS
ncbi:unnamed protein product [Protopolystoma xenopodis]|uniref:Uncharacterized protein n=1 Tax=Protopolystoma xenopodis TaxID=117903 RepID=A0A448X666_9PLAT|nr:unnamed protein product [Protopolystoma xenopodis]